MKYEDRVLQAGFVNDTGNEYHSSGFLTIGAWKDAL